MSRDVIIMASSMTTVDVAILSMGSSSSALANAFPRVIPTSSMRWWSLSPAAFMVISMSEYLERVSIMCFRNWLSQSTSYFPVPSTFSSTEICVSLVFLSILAVLADIMCAVR